MRNWFANRNPLVTRLPYVPVERVDFLMYSHQYRARSTTLANALSSSTTTGLVLGDSTFLMNHDVLQLIDTTTGTRNTCRSTATRPARERAPFSAAWPGPRQRPRVTAAAIVNLIGNSRTGAAVNQTGLTTIGTSRTQYCQTFQFPVQIGGSAQTARAQVMPGGIQSPFDFNMTIQLQNMVDDIENSCYYGIAQAPVDSSSTRPR